MFVLLIKMGIDVEEKKKRVKKRGRWRLYDMSGNWKINNWIAFVTPYHSRNAGRRDTQRQEHPVAALLRS